MNILVIPEDFRKDQYILKPVIEAVLSSIGRSRSKVRVCRDPLLGGVAQALKWERIEEILNRYSGMVNLFLLIVDRDGQDTRRQILDRLEASSNNLLAHRSFFLSENAWQEIEVWVLAWLTLPSNWDWHSIRMEVNPKELYFEPVVKQRGLTDSPGGGRKVLALEAVARYPRTRQLCPEDVEALENRIRRYFRGTTS